MVTSMTDRQSWSTVSNFLDNRHHTPSVCIAVCLFASQSVVLFLSLLLLRKEDTNTVCNCSSAVASKIEFPPATARRCPACTRGPGGGDTAAELRDRQDTK